MTFEIYETFKKFLLPFPCWKTFPRRPGNFLCVLIISLVSRWNFATEFSARFFWNKPDRAEQLERGSRSIRNDPINNSIRVWGCNCESLTGGGAESARDGVRDKGANGIWLDYQGSLDFFHIRRQDTVISSLRVILSASFSALSSSREKSRVSTRLSPISMKNFTRKQCWFSISKTFSVTLFVVRCFVVSLCCPLGGWHVVLWYQTNFELDSTNFNVIRFCLIMD